MMGQERTASCSNGSLVEDSGSFAEAAFWQIVVGVGTIRAVMTGRTMSQKPSGVTVATAAAIVGVILVITALAVGLRG